MYVLLIHILLDTFLQQIIQYKFQDTRLRPDSKYLESADSFGEYVALNPSKADIIWMPDIFIDQVNCMFCWTYVSETAENQYNNIRKWFLNHQIDVKMLDIF